MADRFYRIKEGHRRAQACEQACAGIPTDRLTPGLVREMVEALQATWRANCNGDIATRSRAANDAIKGVATVLDKIRETGDG